METPEITREQLLTEIETLHMEIEKLKETAAKTAEEAAFQTGEKADRAAELVIADKELAFQTGEKADRAAELVIADEELAFQTGEKADRAAELVIANKELAFQNAEKDKRAAELIIANKELAFQNEEKDKRAAELQRVQLLLKSSLESPKDMIILSIDQNYNYYYFNKAHQEAMKSAYDIDVAIGMNLLEAIVSETDRVIARYNYDLALKGESHSTIQKYGTKASSYQETFYNPIINESDEIIGATAFARDVSNRILQEEKIKELNNQLEYRVRERTAQLEAANAELEAFSYSVSHDLKAPLRHITGYVALLVKKYRDLLPEEGLHYLDNVSYSAENMGELIDGLLQFSRTGRVDMNQRLLDMNEMVAALIQPIEEQDTEHRIEWNVEPMPMACGDFAMIRSVWSNLIENAVKFSKNKDLARITIGAEENEADITYYIKDNGPGFDMNYASKLFTIFQRLHSREDYEGTGIGLATVRRIITRHGGKTWAEGKVGEGATIYFSLIKRKESE